MPPTWADRGAEHVKQQLNDIEGLKVRNHGKASAEELLFTCVYNPEGQHDYVELIEQTLDGYNPTIEETTWAGEPAFNVSFPFMEIQHLS